MKKILIIPVIMLLAACATAPQGEKVGPVAELYNSAMDSMAEKNYANAIFAFEELERQHPYSGWATRAQMMVAYAHYRAGDLTEAIVAAERFVRMHPGHPNLDYMYYLRAMANYVQISDVEREQGATRKALESFEEIVRRFPNSKYARDAKFKITLCKDHLAGKELNIGRYYLKQKRYLSAINRFKAVIKNYETSGQTPEALYRLTEAYIALGVNEEAKRAAAILGHNYPNSRWYSDAYALLTKKNLATAGQKKGWGSQLLKGIKGVF